MRQGEGHTSKAQWPRDAETRLFGYAAPQACAPEVMIQPCLIYLHAISLVAQCVPSHLTSSVPSCSDQDSNPSRITVRLTQRNTPTAPPPDPPPSACATKEMTFWASLWCWTPRMTAGLALSWFAVYLRSRVRSRHFRRCCSYKERLKTGRAKTNEPTPATVRAKINSASFGWCQLGQRNQREGKYVE